MGIKQLEKLKSDLLRFQVKAIGANNSARLKEAVQIIVEAIDNEIEKPIVVKKSNIIDIISLLDSNNPAEISTSFPQVNYVELKKVVNSKIDIASLNNYTITQLKVIYYMLTHDKENHAIKTNKKEEVLNAVKEANFSNMRMQKLKDV